MIPSQMRGGEPRPARVVIAVGSGKGGVGKSTVALNVALGLAETGSRVGLLDADLFGPNIPAMMNLTRKSSATTWELVRNPELGQISIEPYERFGIRVMSSGFIIGEDHPLTLASSFVDMIVRQFFVEVQWGELDFLIVDLPPGTADLHQTITRRFPLDAAVVVVTPEEVAHLDGRKAVEMFRRAGLRIAGGVENMAGMTCPHCTGEVELLPPAEPERTIWAHGVERLARVPFDPAVARAGQIGSPVVVDAPGSAAGRAFRDVAARLYDALS